MTQPKLLCEVWEDFSEDGNSLASLEYAGPLGDGARKLLSPRARMLTKIRAVSHFDAMTQYYKLMGWGEYTTDQPWDYQPYPEAWIKQQSELGLV